MKLVLKEPPSLYSLYPLMREPPLSTEGLILRVIVTPSEPTKVGGIGGLGGVAVRISPIGLQPPHPLMFAALYLTL
jgi:hypothetical protein